MMDIRFQAGGPQAWKADAALLFVCSGEDPLKASPALLEAAPWLGISPGLRDFRGDENEITVLYGHPDLNIPRVILVGLGESGKAGVDKVREAAALAARHCRKLRLTSMLLPFECFAGLSGGAARLVEESVYGALISLYRYTALKSADEKGKPDPLWLALGFTESSVPDIAHAAARRGERAARSMAMARGLAITPSNIMTPGAMAEQAVDAARRHGLKCKVHDMAELAEMGCNALLAVGQGSKNEPKMIVLEYAPKGHEEDKPIVLIGKGVTFDSGGISIKPPTDMHQMKGDMTGAAVVLSVMTAVADEDIPRRVVAIMPCAENMPGGGAFKPGDVVKSFSGKTVEIMNTDAEGRMLLCDALAYAQKKYSCAGIVDIATLTGACMVALGREIGGLFSDDEDLSGRIRAIGQTVGEPFWPLPLWSPYRKALKSEVADISHMGPREGGAINAAIFLKEFVNEGTRWAHLDIAGTDWATKDTPLCVSGPTGFGVRTLIDLVRAGL